MADVISVHVLSCLEHLSHYASHEIFREERLLNLMCSLTSSGQCLGLETSLWHELSQALIAGELKDEIAFVDSGVLIEVDQLVDKIAVNLFEDLCLIDGCLFFVHVRRITDLHNELLLLACAAIRAEVGWLNRDELDVLWQWRAKKNFRGATLDPQNERVSKLNMYSRSFNANEQRLMQDLSNSVVKPGFLYRYIGIYFCPSTKRVTN